MSTNHNRIKVADLETNQPNKILKTNVKGELEFSNENTKIETYNALDATTEGKALDARQGKVLKDMISNISTSPPSLVNDLTTGGTAKALTAEMGKTLENTKLTASLATDAETQISSSAAEDNKVVSRVKLFNWWNWIKTQTQNISGTWNFINKVTLATGSTTSPPLVIPNGTLTTTPLNGAIERDSSGKLWTTYSSLRSRLITSSDPLILLAYKFQNNLEVYLQTSISETKQAITSNTEIGKIANISIQRLNATTLTNRTSWNSNPKLPTTSKIEVFLKINNGLFATHWSGSNPVNQIKVMEYSGNLSGYKNYQELLLFNIQNSDPLTAQWSTITFPEQIFREGITTRTDKSYYLRDALNTRTLGASEASFSFAFVNTLDFEDATNANGLNTNIQLRANNYALYIETIR
ncbi:hypothetical protein [Flavobacterium sp. DG2-3]|uniref:hypothetical protein n=1 Tax=Flavobacterium sp. DG2-3 TaxID=3068317 RepID=UPI00273D119A|nr:hypothetical protein [Flavobacterium sp. DG2-3]MDP5201116.1 hypothetical protein [Flavobacterium sp. DG2-3]